ncbi:MAG: hypothetical protein J7M26_03290 [Armatimonadetes bacterium]|nr:hypothetical protein [Armatimonadota bacterium]
MNNRDWIHSISPEERKRRNALIKQHIEEGIAEMERLTEEKCRELKMTSRARAAAEKAWGRGANFRREPLLWPKHTAVERRFLRMMIKIYIAEDPGLVDKAGQLARYLSRNYAFEWTISPATLPARIQARNVLLSEAESEFGETPLARPYAYVLYHHRHLGIKDPANSGEIYAMAVFLEQQRFFMNKAEEQRRALGLHRHAIERQRKAKRKEREGEEAAEQQAQEASASEASAR